MLKIIKKLLFLVIILLAVFIIFFYSVIFLPASHETNLVTFKVAKGETVKQVAENLYRVKLIKSRWAFGIYVWYKDAGSKILAGEHQLVTNMNIPEVFKDLTTSTGPENETSITIIEGWRLVDIADYLNERSLVKKADFLAAAKIDNWRLSYDFLSDKKIKTLEGFLFPDTYKIYRDTSPQVIIKKMLDNFDKKLSSAMRDEIQKNRRNLYDVLILSSIIEDEASSLNDEEMAMVADIFWKRLAIRMPLQSDATVNYATGKSELRPSLQDLEVDSPYNTYKHYGLPPTPIGNPGLASLRAAIFPKSNDYYYFLTDKTGQIFYAKTFSEHQMNVRNHLN